MFENYLCSSSFCPFLVNQGVLFWGGEGGGSTSGVKWPLSTLKLYDLGTTTREHIFHMCRQDWTICGVQHSMMLIHFVVSVDRGVSRGELYFLKKALKSTPGPGGRGGGG